jgi:hypothetical protein
MNKNFSTFLIFLLLQVLANFEAIAYQVIYANNVGSTTVHIDSDGIVYENDNNTAGSQFIWSSTLRIGRVPEKDRIIYSTMRYSTSYFNYSIPVAGDGQYVLNLKFSDVETTAANQRYENIFLNTHLILENLDFYKTAGQYGAFDEFICFEICDNRLIFLNQTSELKENKVNLRFNAVKVYAMVSAIVLLKGDSGESLDLVSSTTGTVQFPYHSQCQKSNNNSTVAPVIPEKPTTNTDGVARFQPLFAALAQIQQSNNTNFYTIFNNYNNQLGN